VATTIVNMGVQAAREWASGVDRKNWANLAAFVLNTIVTYTSLTRAYGEANSDLSAKYQTLITPSGWAFSIWGPIFILEGVFAFAQLSRRLRDAALMQDGVGWWYCVACAAQCGWTFAFAQEQLWLALIFMLAILAALALQLRATGALVTPSTPPLEYWTLHAPFALHAGWIAVASALSVNVVVVDSGGAADQLATAVVSLAALAALGVGAAAAAPHATSPWIAGVAAWALGAVASELGNPESADLVARFACASADGTSGGGMVTDALARASAALAIALAALSVAIAVAPWCRAALAEHRAPTTKQEEAGAGVSVQSPATASPV
jgi:hypothetical protein